MNARFGILGGIDGGNYFEIRNSIKRSYFVELNKRIQLH